MGETCLDRKQRGGGGGWGGRSRAKAQVAVRAVRRFRGLVEWMTRLVLATICGGGEMRTLVYYHAGRTDGRAVSEPLELWKCKCKCSVGLSSAAATNGLYAARLAHSSSSRLAARANHGTLLASICSTAARRDGIGPPGTCILFNCCSTSWPTCIVIFVRCQFALGVAQASPASSQEKVLVHVTWPCASSLSHSAAPCMRPKQSCGEDQVCWATDSQCETQRLLLLCRTAWFAQQRTFRCFSSGGRPNIWSRCLCLANPYVAHRQLQTSHLITPLAALHMDRKDLHAQAVPLRCSHRWELIWFVMADCSMLEVPMRQLARDGDLWLAHLICIQYW